MFRWVSIPGFAAMWLCRWGRCAVLGWVLTNPAIAHALQDLAGVDPGYAGQGQSPIQLSSEAPSQFQNPLPAQPQNSPPPEHPLSAATRYQIDRQPLTSALTQFAEQSGLQILFRTQGIPTLVVGPLQGNYAPQEALSLLLDNTHLHYRFGAGTAVVIFQQDNSPPVSDKANGAEQNAGNSPDAEAKNSASSLEEIWVTGIRGSIQRNLLQKQNANAMVDIITSEDVGKFPDKNIADSLQRIPGVSVDRIWGEGRDINIRGTDKDINRTLMNGQNVASAYWWANDNPSRGFNYTILASELISSLAVYKSPEADIDEGSIGGTVIIYTHKPFDMKSNTLNLAMEEQYSELPDAWDPQLSLLGSWKNTEQTWGLLASFNWQNRSMRRDGLEAFPDNTLYSVVDDQGGLADDVYVIWGGGSAIFQEERARKTNNMTLQWAPNSAWELVFNYVESSLDMTNSNQNFLFMPGGFKLRETPPAIVSHPRYGNTGDGRQTLLGGIVGNPDSPGAALDAIFRDAYLRSAVYDFDANYKNDTWSLHLQAGITAAEGGSQHDRLYRFLGNTREQFSLTRDSIEVQYLDLNPEDAGSLTEFSSESHDWIRKMEDDETYAQVDYQWEPLQGFISAVKAGIKWRDQTIENNRTIGSIDTSHPDWGVLQSIGLDQVSDSLTPELHRQTATQGSLTRFAWADKALLNQVVSPLLDSGLMVYRYDENAFYEIDEQIKAAYLKANFARGGWRGNLGVRVVNTQQTSMSYRDQVMLEAHRGYNDYLPSVNLAYDFNSRLLWRTSLSKVMARPTYQNLSSNIVIDGTNGTASGGTPDLEPFRAKQFDTGFEWYFDKTAILSATYFYKSISTYIYNETHTETINNALLNVTRPYNAEGARISGWELQWQEDFGSGFGWLSNYTYTHARVPSQDQQQILKLPGNSRDQINTSIYYENDQYSLRLSHNYRSTSYGELISGTQDETRAYRQWDLSCSWVINSNINMFAEAINLTNEPIYSRTANEIPQGLYENGRRFALGARLTF